MDDLFSAFEAARAKEDRVADEPVVKRSRQEKSKASTKKVSDESESEESSCSLAPASKKMRVNGGNNDVNDDSNCNNNANDDNANDDNDNDDDNDDDDGDNQSGEPLKLPSVGTMPVAEGSRRTLVSMPDSSDDGKACSHEVVYPPDYDPSIAEANKNVTRDADRPPARTYPFELDPFQKESVKTLEAGESVMVSAHTSAGKTAVAEYAIAMCLREGSRVIYTSPLKALGNQKYRDLHEIFGDVGLMTGDVTISPNASCLVMTAEILRSMLYRGSEIMREVSIIIMDEIHYLNDKERGVVWEETIILLPEKVHYVFLSATVPNAPEFAAWIAKIHHQPVHVVYTEYRPTPLQHYIYPTGGDGVHLVVDERGQFRQESFQRALSVLAPDPIGEADSGNGKRKKPTKGGASDIYKIVKMIMDRKYEPVIVFGFSRKECERMASQMAKLDVQGAEEKRLVEEVFKNAIETLNEEDRRLPQIQQILPLLRRGIGIHHSGLLPILKEVIEILFQENLLKCLFATETFSIGLNMPARTVVFTSLRKFDGESFRWVSSGEYIQMSGRAGRRGLDDRGIVIMMLDEKMEPDACKGMLRGKADLLRSSFHLSYNMLLNLMRVEEIRAEDLLGKSFLQFQNERALPALMDARTALEGKRDAVVIDREDEVAEYARITAARETAENEARDIITKPKWAIPFLQPGRLVKIIERKKKKDLRAKNKNASGDEGDNSGVSDSAATAAAVADDGEEMEVVEWGWGAVVAFQRRDGKGEDARDYIVDVLVECEPGVDASRPWPIAHRMGADGNAIDIDNDDDDDSDDDDNDNDGDGDGIGNDKKQKKKDSGKNSVYKAMKAAEAAKKNKGKGNDDKKKVNAKPRGEMHVVPVVLSLVHEVSSIRVLMPKDLRPSDARAAVGRSIDEVKRRFPRGVPKLDPIEDMGIKDPALKRAIRRTEELHRELVATKLYREPRTRGRLLRVFRRKEKISDQIKDIRAKIKESESVIMLSSLRRMKRVLRRLGYADKDNVIATKGRFACEVSTADEILITELVFNGAFNDLTPERAAALVSCLIYQEKSNENLRLRDDLEAPFRVLQDTARRVGKVCIECKIQMDLEEYVSSFKADMMEIVYAWCKGSNFLAITQMTDIFEGSIVRNMRRLEEFLRQLSGAAGSIGNTELKDKFDKASELLKRDIVFSASLYL